MSTPGALRLLALVPAGFAEVADPLAAVRAARAIVATRAAPTLTAVVVDARGDAAAARERPGSTSGSDAAGGSAADSDAAAMRGADLAAAACAAGADEACLVVHPWLGVDPSADSLVTLFAAALQRLGVAGDDAQRTLVVAPAGGGEEIVARLAARLSGVPLGRCSALAPDAAGGVQATRSAYGGRAEVRTHSARGPWFAALRGGKGVPRAARVRRLDLDVPLPPSPIRARTDPAAAPRQAALEGARIVVSGGRGLGGPQGFELLRQVADAVGGALGGSLPTVDSGWLPVARQVGQSGTYVTPAIYFAVAISGTPQHLAGIGPDTRIVAVNNDPDADIFKVAEVGAVADWKQVVPALIEALQARPSGEPAP